MDLSILKSIKRGRLKAAQAAGTSDITSDTFDARGFMSVEFGVTFGAITSGAVTSVKVQESADDSSWADLSGVSKTVADTDDDKIVRIEVVRPLKRYLRVIVDRGTQNAVVDSIDYLASRGSIAPITQDTDIVDGGSHVSPVAA